jgi:hypothetical protein
VVSIEAFKPEGPRRLPGSKQRLKPKGKYEFLVLYDLPRSTEKGDENPAWQPYENVKHLAALKEFCAQPHVLQQLGDTFYVSDNEVAGEE